MEKRVNRLVSTWGGTDAVCVIGCALKYDMVTVYRGGKRFDDPTEIEFAVSWWSGRSQDSTEVKEFAEALLEADKFIHSVKTDKVFVVKWEQDEEKHSQGVLHISCECAKEYLVQRAQMIRSENPGIEHELPFEIALRSGEWSELGVGK